MITKAIDNSNFNHLIPLTFPITSSLQIQKIDNLLIIPQKVNYNPMFTKSQGKKLEIIKKNEK
jgi:hypothetical protein